MALKSDTELHCAGNMEAVTTLMLTLKITTGQNLVIVEEVV